MRRLLNNDVLDAQPVVSEQTAGGVDYFLPVEWRELCKRRSRKRLATVRAPVGENDGG